MTKRKDRVGGGMGLNELVAVWWCLDRVDPNQRKLGKQSDDKKEKEGEREKRE